MNIHGRRWGNSALHCTALHYIALHCTALHCRRRGSLVFRRKTSTEAREEVAVQCSAVQCSAVQCTLEGTLCSAVQCTLDEGWKTKSSQLSGRDCWTIITYIRTCVWSSCNSVVPLAWVGELPLCPGLSVSCIEPHFCPEYNKHIVT
jgi:hypothetical protein